MISQVSEYMCEIYMITSEIMWDECSSLNKHSIFNRNQIYINAHLTTESIILLLENNKLWDAEILNRSILEWTIKYTYLCLGDIDNTTEKINDFSEIIPDFNAVKRSNKVEELLKIFQDKDDIYLIPFKQMLLSDDQKKEYYKGLSKSERKRIEDRWSFNGMLKSIVDHDMRYEKFINLAHQYSMSSHLIHMDGDAVGMIWERTQRDKQERELLEFSQTCRLLSELINLYLFRSQLVFELNDYELVNIQKVNEKYKNLFSSLSKFSRLFGEKYY